MKAYVRYIQGEYGRWEVGWYRRTILGKIKHTPVNSWSCRHDPYNTCMQHAHEWFDKYKGIDTKGLNKYA